MRCLPTAAFVRMTPYGWEKMTRTMTDRHVPASSPSAPGAEADRRAGMTGRWPRRSWT